MLACSQQNKSHRYHTGDEDPHVVSASMHRVPRYRSEAFCDVNLEASGAVLNTPIAGARGGKLDFAPGAIASAGGTADQNSEARLG
jgi:hypothetical protein